jgi:hypothetical protein
MVDPETVDLAGDPYVLYVADVHTELFSGVSSIASCLFLQNPFLLP